MSKLMVVARREFRETVRKRSFLILTILMPILFAGLIAVPSLLINRSSKEKKVLVLDGTRILATRISDAVTRGDDDDESPKAGLGKDTTGVDAKGLKLGPPPAPTRVNVEVRAVEDPVAASVAALEDLKNGTLDALALLPGDLVVGSSEGTYYARNTTDLVTRRRVTNAIATAVVAARFENQGVTESDAQRILRRPRLNAIQIKRSGESKSGGEADFIVGFLFAGMMFVPLIFHGQGILHSVIQEKSDRIVETLVSSMTAFELLTGKIVGLAAVGLLQIAIWTTMGFAISTLGGAALLSLGVNPFNLLSPMKVVLFAVFFLLGYFIYACVYATAGSCVNSEKEAQQVFMPVFMALMVPWMIMMFILMDPDSLLAISMSLAPIYAPLVMFVRVLVADPPWWQVATSIGVSLLTIFSLFWLAARIFRVGILSYGKRPSLPEFLRWLRHP